jgi:succinyl-CoA synthetase beta subunit
VIGSGGVFAELVGDAAVALAPLERGTALGLPAELRVAAQFAWARGRAPLDADAAAEVLVALARFAAAHPEVAAAEINPLLMLPQGALALDARIVLCDEAPVAHVAAGTTEEVE